MLSVMESLSQAKKKTNKFIDKHIDLIFHGVLLSVGIATIFAMLFLYVVGLENRYLRNEVEINCQEISTNKIYAVNTHTTMNYPVDPFGPAIRLTKRQSREYTLSGEPFNGGNTYDLIDWIMDEHDTVTSYVLKHRRTGDEREFRRLFGEERKMMTVKDLIILNEKIDKEGG